MRETQEPKRSTAEKLARHLHNHVASVWRRDGFCRLSTAELRDKSNFLFIGDEGNRSDAEREMIAIAERYLVATKNQGLAIIGVRVQEKSIKGHDGDEVQLILKPTKTGGESVLVMFAARTCHDDFFLHELLPYAQFAEREPLVEPPARTARKIGQVWRTKTVDGETLHLSYPTPIGMVFFNPQTGTVAYTTADGKECGYSSTKRTIFVNGNQVTIREEVPLSFVSAINGITNIQMEALNHRTNKIAELFNTDYAALGKTAAQPASANTHEMRIEPTLHGAFTFHKNGRVVYTSDSKGIVCEYMPGTTVILVDRKIVRRHADIPREFLEAVVELRKQLAPHVLRGIENAVFECIPEHLRKGMGRNTNAIKWCIRTAKFS